MKKYEFLEHKADIRIKAYGKNFEEALLNSAYALKKVILKKEINEKEEIKEIIKIKGNSKEEILHKFLEEFLFILDSKKELLIKIEKINLEKKEIVLYAKFQKIKENRINNPIKAIVYNDILIKELKDKTTIEFTLDL